MGGKGRADRGRESEPLQESCYDLLNDQTWTAIFSWLTTADLARSRV